MHSVQTHTLTLFLSSCLTLQQPGGRGRALEARSLTGPEESPGPDGQGHPEGQELLFSPPVLPFLLLLLPPYLPLFLLTSVLMPRLSQTALEPLPHCDHGGDAGVVRPGCEEERRMMWLF